MKGAVDGGLAIPHGDSGKQFPGWSSMEGQTNFDTDVLRKYIMGGHVADYMNKLQEEDEEAYSKQFANYIKEGVSADDLEDLYATAHEKIREDPSALPKKVSDKTQKSKYAKTPKTSLAQKRDHVLNKILAIRSKATINGMATLGLRSLSLLGITFLISGRLVD